VLLWLGAFDFYHSNNNKKTEGLRLLPL